MNFKSTNKVINAISECEKYEANTSIAIYLQGLRTREKKIKPFYIYQTIDQDLLSFVRLSLESDFPQNLFGS